MDDLQSFIRLLFDGPIVSSTVAARLHLFAVVNDGLKDFQVLGWLTIG